MATLFIFCLTTVARERDLLVFTASHIVAAAVVIPRLHAKVKEGSRSRCYSGHNTPSGYTGPIAYYKKITENTSKLHCILTTPTLSMPLACLADSFFLKLMLINTTSHILSDMELLLI